MLNKGVDGLWMDATEPELADKRVTILTRSAFTGQQRNGAITWSGDINASYDVLRRQISAGLNFCYVLTNGTRNPHAICQIENRHFVNRKLIRTISGLFPNRNGGPQVPYPQET